VAAREPRFRHLHLEQLRIRLDDGDRRLQLVRHQRQEVFAVADDLTLERGLLFRLLERVPLRVCHPIGTHLGQRLDGGDRHPSPGTGFVRGRHRRLRSVAWMRESRLRAALAAIVDEPVPEPGLGEDVLRVAGVWLELLPQIRDVEPNVVVLFAVLVPHTLASSVSYGISRPGLLARWYSSRYSVAVSRTDLRLGRGRRRPRARVTIFYENPHRTRRAVSCRVSRPAARYR
jgi:hypothetical protein